MRVFWKYSATLLKNHNPCIDDDDDDGDDDDDDVLRRSKAATK